MSSSTRLDALLQTMSNRTSPDALHGSLPLRIARPLDAESLIGRHEGRARKTAGGGARPALSAALQRRIGPTRGLAERAPRSAGFAFDTRQRAIVKVHYFGHGGGGAAALRAHIHYLDRDVDAAREPPPAKAREVAERDAAPERARAHARYLSRAGRAGFYDALEDGVDGAARAALWSRADRRHFRIILAPENGSRIGDLRAYTREVMTRAEAALGTPLEWFAVDHRDTDNPHTHIVLRGRRADGRDLVIPRDFVSHGFRNAARDAATDRLGARSRDDERLALRREARAHRPTRLDPLLEAEARPDGTLRLARLRAPNGAPDWTDALKARAQELKRLGLAVEERRNVLRLTPGWREALKAMELHLDIRKSLLQARAAERDRTLEHPARSLARGLRLGPDR